MQNGHACVIDEVIEGQFFQEISCQQEMVWGEMHGAYFRQSDNPSVLAADR